MERYSGGQRVEGGEVDPVMEWGAPGEETGLEEPMWQMGVNTGQESYPERLNEPDCIYYLRTGFCGYGALCRFNHPPDRSAAVGAMRASGGEYPERVGQPVCQYYMKTGMCKFGASCKYHHPKQGASATPVTLNIYGYPMRSGEKECMYYVKTGECKFGLTCKFHHPQPAMIQASTVTPGPRALAAPAPAIYHTVQSPSFQSSQQFGVMSGNWPVARPTLLPGSYIPGTYGPVMLPPGMVTVPGWSPYPAPASPVASPNTQHTVGAGAMYGIPQLSASASAYTGQYLSVPSSIGPSSSMQREHTYPERPGQPECQYYMKTGDCKYGYSCKYHHPSEWSESRSNYPLSPMGLPLRPGVPICSHYAQNGACKYGASCKFDHPMGSLSYSPSASSLADMPVAPYPVGSSVGTLAPSSSSSNLRPEVLSGASKDALSTRMSSMSTSSGSIGSMFSKSIPAAGQSSGQQPEKSSTTSSSAGKIGEEGDPHSSS
ncbi:protein phosphatase [Lithospermum erythrorhizon]|uniref:Protein phosphatase n=1 Tax=Lithospermum erythrorhizon TaxID=34254 RepID=A0AAV3RGZ1_LITER